MATSAEDAEKSFAAVGLVGEFWEHLALLRTASEEWVVKCSAT
jgi:hypothetical protein